MAKTLQLLFCFLSLVAFAHFTPLRNGENCIDCYEPLPKPQYQQGQPGNGMFFKNLFQSIGGMVTGIIHESGVHKERQQALKHPAPRIYNIGNGKRNGNRVTINEWY